MKEEGCQCKGHGEKGSCGREGMKEGGRETNTLVSNKGKQPLRP